MSEKGPRWITAAEVSDEEAGDVQGPDSSVDGNIALFDGTTGKLLKAAGAIPGGGATIESTNNILVGDGAGNAISTGETLTLPANVTMVSPGTDVNIPSDCDLTTFFGENGTGYINANGVNGELTMSSGSGNPDGNRVAIASGDSSSETDGNGGDIQLQPGSGTGSGRNGAVWIRGFAKLDLLDDPPNLAEEGMIYADTDHHLYYYNGTTWKQLDN